ncbi:MAG: cbb3-type cytochrome c oxidase subunit I [Elusimicrobia bacterium]|nr:cbb3-type cytochrome c oxidase subunit I [Elusimicrobiota bacterium]
MTEFFASLAAGVVVFVAGYLGLRGPLGPQGACVLAYLASLLAVLGVVGGAKAMRSYALGREPEEKHGVARYFSFDVDHKVVGIQYTAAAVVIFLVGGLLALTMRLELARHGLQYLTPEQYVTVMSLHGITMVVVALIATAGGLGNFVVPLQIGARDMAFPRLNALSFWLLPPAVLLLLASPFLGGLDFGWTAIAPLSTQGTTIGKQMFVLAFVTAGFSSIFGGVNFVATVLTMRAPGMGWNVLLYQHLFWYYSHPAVYIMILPAFGAVLEIIPVYARKPLFAYKLVAGALMTITALSFIVWAHHMFTSGMWMLLKLPFMVNTELISIPTGVVFLAVMGTLWKAKLRLDSPMLWALAMVANFLIGGLTGIPLADAPTDLHLHDTWFIVAHFHFTIMGGAVFGFFAGFHHWFPKMTGKRLNETLAKTQCALMFVGFNAVFIPLFWLGNHGMRRHVADFPEWMDPVQTFASLAALVVGSSVIVFSYNVLTSLRRGEEAGMNPWEALTLEWKAASPPPHGNFKTPPVVSGEPYDYGVEA